MIESKSHPVLVNSMPIRLKRLKIKDFEEHTDGILIIKNTYVLFSLIANITVQCSHTYQHYIAY